MFASEELDTAWREVLRTQHSTLDELFVDGVIITEEHFSELIAHIDSALHQDEIAWRNIEEMNEGVKMQGAEGDRGEGRSARSRQIYPNLYLPSV